MASPLYVPLPPDVAASVLSALSAPGAAVDPSLAELRKHLTAALSCAGQARPSSSQASGSGPLDASCVAVSHGLWSQRRPHQTQTQTRRVKFRSSSVPLETCRTWENLMEEDSSNLTPSPGSLVFNTPPRTVLPSRYPESGASSVTLNSETPQMPHAPYLSPLRFTDTSHDRTPPCPSAGHPPFLSKRLTTDTPGSEQGPAKRRRVILLLPQPPTKETPSPTDEESEHRSDSSAEESDQDQPHLLQLRRRRRRGTGTGTKKCPRKGDGARVGGDADIGHVDCAADRRCEECHSSGQQKGGLSGGLQQSSNQGPDASGAKTQGKKRKAKRRQWREDPEGGPRITGQAGKVLARLLGILTTPSRAHLDDLLSHLLAAELVEPLDLEGAVERVKQLDVGLKHHELNYMLALVQLTLHVHSTKRNAVLKHLPKVTGEALVERFASKVNRKTFLDWLSCGQKLMVLCAAGTMYILPILAALDMRTTITRQCAEEDVISLANALREVKHGQWLSLVRKLMVPIHHLATLPPSVFSKLSLHYNIPKQTGEDPETRHYFFQETEDLDTLFSEIETNYPKLPTRSPEWCSPSIEPWLPYPAPQVSLTNTITTPLVLGKKKMPFIKKNRDKWTEKERAKASKAPVASSLEDLQSRVDVMHEGGKVKPDQYIEVNTRILEGKPLYIRDANGKLLSLAFTVPEHIKKALEDAIMLIQAAMPGEFKDEDSKRALYRYLSCHYTWYARFAEKGEGAPPDVHPNNLRSDNHEGHVNFNQRFPHQSKEIIENREEFLILAQAYQAFFEWLRVQLKHLLPEEFEQLSIWCDALPLGSDSPAAPFGGFVINLNVCTWAHRDKGDKLICIVVPFGKFRGGQLCLYEAGFCWDLQLGDVLVFPSCDLTHFNLDFTGQRGTLVLHSDREADSWIRDRNGWSAHIVTHK